MTASLALFILFAALVVVLLAWAARPHRKTPLTVEEVFESLSGQRHYARLPQILQSLREEDTEFMRGRGHRLLLIQVREQRRQIALNYLKYLQEEFQTLQECSSILATLAPELPAGGEFDRLRQNLRFVWTCRYLSWRLRMGLQPWDAFGTLSDMAGTATLRLEAAAVRLGERALLASDAGGLASKNRRIDAK
jgi:hypothetical protein